MGVAKMHRTVKFRQKTWMAPCIKVNTELRAKAKSEFHNDFFNLKVNWVFDRAMDSLRKSY